MQTGYIQFDVRHDREANFAAIEKQLKAMQADLVVLPELCVCGYLFKDRAALFAASETVPEGPSTQKMLALSAQYGCALIFGLAERDGDAVYNTAVVVNKGRYIGKYRKIHLSDLEKQLFSCGKNNRVFTVSGHKIGVQICFDLWFPEIAREQMLSGAQLLCVLGNFGGETTFTISQTRAIENLTPLVLCNRVGQETMPGLTADFLGKSAVTDADGRRIITAKEGCSEAAVCEISLAVHKSNVICKDFDAEFARHHRASETI